MLKPTLIVAGVVLLPLAGFSAFLLVSTPEDYRSKIISRVQQETGATLTLAEPLHWQLWPFGIKLGKISLLESKSATSLLDASSAVMSINPLSLLSGKPEASGLALEGALITVRENADGLSNWDAVLRHRNEHPASSIDSISLSDSSLILNKQKAGFETTDEFVIGQLSLSGIATGKPMPFAVAFSFSRQSVAGSNVLSQNILTATIINHASKPGFDLKDAQLSTEISSTFFPGNLKLLLEGDFSKEGHILASNTARMTADYKNLIMTEALHGSMSSKVLANFDLETLTLNKLQFNAVDGAKNATAMSADLAVNWRQGEIQARDLKASTSILNFLSQKPLPLQVSANLDITWPQGNVAVSNLLINAGGVAVTGTLKARVPSLQDGLMQPQMLLQGMKLQGQLNSDSFDMTALLAALGLAGKANSNTPALAQFHTDIEGRDDTLLLKNLALTLDKTTLRSEVSLNGLTAAPAYKLDAKLDSTDISPVSRLFGHELSGSTKASIKAQMQGASFAEMIASATGESRITLENGRLQGTNFMSSLVERLGSYGALMPELAADAGNKAGNYTDITSLAADNSFNKGIIASKTFSANFGKASLKGKGSFDTSLRIMDYTLTLNLDKSLFAANAKNLQLLLRCQGNLAEEQLEFVEALGADCKTDDKATSDVIAGSLIERFRGKQP